jgi:hypothetical protein
VPAAPPAGVGLPSMAERAAELGGHCQVTRLDGGGTRVLAQALLRSGGSGMRRLLQVCSSDRQRELGEGGRQAERRWDVGGEFVVAAAEVLHERVTGRESCRGAEAFQAAHWP